MKSWQLQEAKAHLSELVRESADGPQVITVHGKAAAVILSKADYDRLQGLKPSLLEFLRKSPLAGIAVRIERDRSRTRNVKL
jgi:prevent-host-death family protein